MKTNNYLFRFLSSVALSIALSLGNVFCLVTAFGIPVKTVLLAAICFVFAFVFSALFMADRTYPIPIVMVILGVLMFAAVYRHEIVSGFHAAENTMLSMYSEAYGWVFDVDELYLGADATYMMAVVGGLVSLTTSWTVSRQDGLFSLAAISGGLLSPCLMIIQSPPSPVPLITLLCAYTVILLTQTVRRHSDNGQYPAVWGMALPAILTVAILYSIVLSHPATASDWIEKMRFSFKQTAERYAIFRQDAESGRFEFVNPIGQQTLGEYKWNEDLSEVDLSTLAGQRSSRERVMRIFSDREGTVYLRGNSFQGYEDNTWRSMKEDFYSMTTVPEEVWNAGERYFMPYSSYKYSGYSPSGTYNINIAIETDAQSRIMYLPFVPGGIPEGGQMYYDEYVINQNRLTAYNAPFAWYAYSTGTSEDYERFVYNTYRQIPTETRETLDELFADGGEALNQFANIDSDDVIDDVIEEYYGENLAYLVSEYVKNVAEYDLATPSVPEGEDFVSWFLTESETGYCVHFATAATMLLRYFNIPARYVNGYVIDTTAGEWVDVTQNEAHAWVEFYSRSQGWCLLEVTPEVGDAQLRAEAQEEEPDYTPPEEEQEPEKPDIPEEEEPQPEETPAPIDTEKRFVIPKWVWYAVGFIAICVAWNVTIRKLRQRYVNTGGRNKRTVRLYRRIVFLSRLIDEKPDEDVSGIANKARFSQHTVTEDELNTVIAEAERLTYRVHTLNNPIKRFVYRYILCI